MSIGNLMKRISWLAVFSTFLSFSVFQSGACAHPSSLYIQLFQAKPRVDSIFVQAPFALVNPTYLFIREGTFEISSEGGGLKVSRIDGGKKKELLRAPSVVLSTRISRYLQIGTSRDKLRKYYGEITIKRKQPTSSERHPGLLAINLIDQFNYVASVVGSETTPDFGKEALKAQAVLVYTRLWGKGRHSNLNDTTDEMVYLGAEYERPEVIDAVNEIDRAKLLFNGSPAQAFFHACCAGRTSKGTDIFGENAKSMTYLQSVPCNFCKGSPLYGETVSRVPAASFEREIADREPKVLKSDEAKRIVLAEIARHEKKELISGYQLWLRIGQRLGWDKAPGARYEVKRTGSTYTVKSSGGGHGVGMCQWGAQGLAKQNKSYLDILKYYFPGTTVEKREIAR